MTRYELAHKVFEIVKRDTNFKDVKIWESIAGTSDDELLKFYEEHKKL